MTRQVLVLEEAEEELSEAEEWYEARRPGLGLQFRSAVEDALDRLVDSPGTARPAKSVPAAVGARSVSVKRFPYAVVFIEHEGDLWILAFAHHRRRPGYWRDRMEGAS